MPLCGFNEKMIRGIAVFAEGLFEATLDRAEKEGNDIETAFKKESVEIGKFLNALEDKYQEVKLTHGSEETMKKTVQWIKDNDRR